MEKKMEIETETGEYMRLYWDNELPCGIPSLISISVGFCSSGVRQSASMIAYNVLHNPYMYAYLSPYILLYNPTIVLSVHKKHFAP